jgi:repressor LexA
MNIHEKIAYLLKQKGRGSQTELATILGEDKTYLNKWVKGSKPVPQQHLLGTALYLGVTVDYLMDDNQEIPMNKHIPLIGSASCGVPTDGFYGDSTEYVSVSQDVDATSSYAVRAVGDSMQTAIHEGDLVICDTNKPPSDNTVVHYSFDGDSGIKRISRQEDGSILLLPDNATCHQCKPIMIPKERADDLYTARCVQVTKTL